MELCLSINRWLSAPILKKKLFDFWAQIMSWSDDLFFLSWWKKVDSLAKRLGTLLIRKPLTFCPYLKKKGYWFLSIHHVQETEDLFFKWEEESTQFSINSSNFDKPLTVEILTHTGVQPYKCTPCKKLFTVYGLPISEVFLLNCVLSSSDLKKRSSVW